MAKQAKCARCDPGIDANIAGSYTWLHSGGTSEDAWVGDARWDDALADVRAPSAFWFCAGFASISGWAPEDAYVPQGHTSSRT